MPRATLRSCDGGAAWRVLIRDAGPHRQPSDRAGAQARRDYKLNFRESAGTSSGPHWAVIVQTNTMSRSSTTLAVPITTNAASAALKPEYLVTVSARETGCVGGFIHRSVFTFPTGELEERAGVLAGRKLDELNAALAFVLDLACPVRCTTRSTAGRSGTAISWRISSVSPSVVPART